MDRAYLAGASVNPPPVPASPSPGYPTAGNPSTGTPATTPGPYWYHMVMEELMSVISAAGLTPDHENLTQLAQAVQQLVSSAGKPELRSISATVAANALTVTVQPAKLDFRSATLGSGTVNTRTLAAAASLTVPSGATLGTANGVASRLVVLLLDNAGTLEPAIVNLAGGVNLDETGVISTTAISAAANSASVVYSQTGRVNLSYRVVGFVESTQAVAGTWATAPSLVQGTGGRASEAVGFPGVLTGNGWIKLPGGLILQWGQRAGVSSGTSSVTFPIAYPTACVAASCTRDGTSATANEGAPVITSRSVTGLTVDAVRGTSPKDSFGWIALGY